MEKVRQQKNKAKDYKYYKFYFRNSTPYEGIGKPEALKYGMIGLWSRRINQEDRFVHEIIGEMIIVHSLKGHYQ